MGVVLLNALHRSNGAKTYTGANVGHGLLHQLPSGSRTSLGTSARTAGLIRLLGLWVIVCGGGVYAL